MGTFEVNVIVVEPENEPGVLHINCHPERLLLDGDIGTQIIWTMLPNSLGTFTSADDIRFISDAGQSRFTVTHNPMTGQITGTVNDKEDDETIYTYFLTVHMAGNITIRVDPEVDNPPPPPFP